MCDGMCPGWGHSTGMSFTWEVKNKFLSNSCIVILMAPQSDEIHPLAFHGGGSLQMARGCQSGPTCAERGPTAQMSALLLCPMAWGNHSSILGKKQQRGKQSRMGLACSTHPPYLEEDLLLCWAGYSTCLHPGLGEQHMLEKAGFPAAFVSAGGPDLPFAHIKGNTQLTRDFFVQSDHLQGTASSPCAHGVSLSCTLDHEHGGRDWVLDWGKDNTGVKQRV